MLNKMPTPKEVFDDPQLYWNLITSVSDDDFEDQFFDRKEISSKDGATIEHIQKTISAFANTNQQGGLLVLGVSKTGEVKGVKSFTEKFRNSCTNISTFLKNHSAVIKSHNCINTENKEDQIILIYSMYVPNAICQSLENSPKAWTRSGSQNILMSREIEDQIKRQKGIINFESSPCCEFRIEEVDEEVFKQFSGFNIEKDEEVRSILYNIGALCIKERVYFFTNAGLLFFASNPQRLLKYAHIRLAKFEVEISEWQNRGLPTKEIVFDGPLAKQILKARAFLKESGFFKIYQRRNIGGGFVEEPEFPINAIDEGIVNAVAHRDYGISLEIECLYYKDAFYIANPGIIKQRDHDVPNEFTLEDTVLVSTPSNSLIVDWLKQVKDDKGNSFVQKWGEGTKAMKKAMDDAKLPSPLYRTSIRQTNLTLKNNYLEREALLRSINKVYSSNSSEFLNFFKLLFFSAEGIELLPVEISLENKEILFLLKNKLESENWYIDKVKFGRLKAHKKKSQIASNDFLKDKIRLFPSYLFQIRKYNNSFFLVIDYSIEVKNTRKLSEFDNVIKETFLNLKADVFTGTSWVKGKILSVDEELAKILNFESGNEEYLKTTDIIPDLPYLLLLKTLGGEGSQLPIILKKAALTITTNAVRERINKTLSIATELDKYIFPIQYGNINIGINKSPVPLTQESTFSLGRIEEPKIELGSKVESVNIAEGITKYGSYNSNSKRITIIPICINGFKEKMVNLIYRLQTGKYKYKGVENTFNARFIYDSVYEVRDENEILKECKRLLEQYPEWVGNKEVDRIFLIQISNIEKSREDFNSQYFRIKKYLFENGIPCQMVSANTIDNPDWKDLNLTLNIVAKCGVTPWVLPNKIPEADFFIGLSYSQFNNYKKGEPRLVGYANVISSYGKWEFFSGKTKSFQYDERKKYFADLTKEILIKLDNRLPESPNIHFHYSSKFSNEDRESILAAAREVRPNGNYTFTSLNTQHIIRLYDDKPDTDGSLSRGSYIQLKKNQLLLSTTGFNILGKTLGTPKPIEATVWNYSLNNNNFIDLRSIAVQILSLTKLNWASTSSITTEPITIKYAGNIAYLTLAFLHNEEEFVLHKVLENTPWFL